jgi:hypothetical protein
MRSCRPKSIALDTILLGACWGCGPSAGVPVALLPVKGKVTYKGQPLTTGIIRFDPTNGYGRMATGKIQSDGSFVLSTLKDGDGVVAGAHKVFITDVDTALAKDRVFKNKYMAASDKGLVAEVSPEKTEFTFDLK